MNNKKIIPLKRPFFNNFGPEILNCFRNMNFNYDIYPFVNREKTLEDLANFKFDDLNNPDLFIKIKVPNENNPSFYPTVFWCEQVKNAFVHFLSFFRFDDIYNIIKTAMPSNKNSEQFIRTSLLNALKQLEQAINSFYNVCKNTNFLLSNNLNQIETLQENIKAFKSALRENDVLYANNTKGTYENLLLTRQNDETSPLNVFSKHLAEGLGFFNNPNLPNGLANWINTNEGAFWFFRKYAMASVPFASFLAFSNKTLQILNEKIKEAINKNDLASYLHYALNYYNFYKKHSVGSNSNLVDEKTGISYEIKDILDLRKTRNILKSLYFTDWHSKEQEDYWQVNLMKKGWDILYYDKVALDININGKSFLEILKEIDVSLNNEDELIGEFESLVLNKEVQKQFDECVVNNKPFYKTQNTNFDVNKYKKFIDLSNENTKKMLLELHENYLKFMKFNILLDTKDDLEEVCASIINGAETIKYDKSILDNYKNTLDDAKNNIINKQDETKFKR